MAQLAFLHFSLIRASEKVTSDLRLCGGFPDRYRKQTIFFLGLITIKRRGQNMYENYVVIVRLISIWNKNKKTTPVSLLMIPSLKSNEMYFSLPV